MNTKFLCIEPS